MGKLQLSLDQAAAQVPDGATVALGGIRLQRRPMALVRALVDAGRRNLTIISFLGGLEVEVLLAAGCVSELHAPAVGLDAAGLAPRFRAARQQGTVRFYEWSEGLLLTALEAAARGVPSFPAWMGLGSDLPTLNPWLRPGVDPFEGTPVMNVRALSVELTLLHVPYADVEGNLYVEGDLGADGLLARAAARTLVSYECGTERDPLRAAVSRVWVDGLVPAHRGAWPAGCHPEYGVDSNAVRRWVSDGTLEAIVPS